MIILLQNTDRIQQVDNYVGLHLLTRISYIGTLLLKVWFGLNQSD
jgi:hypothetical protein